jgi:hypothetical protein
MCKLCSIVGPIVGSTAEIRRRMIIVIVMLLEKLPRGSPYPKLDKFHGIVLDRLRSPIIDVENSPAALRVVVIASRPPTKTVSIGLSRWSIVNIDSRIFSMLNT